MILTFKLTECSNKGCRNLDDRKCKSNNGLQTSICNNWTMKLNVVIAIIKVQNAFIIAITPQTGLAHFKVKNLLSMLLWNAKM